MKFMPLGDRLIIKPDAEKDQLESGLFIANPQSLGPTQTGTVEAVGNGVYDAGVHVPVRVQVGDKVLFSRQAVASRQINIEGGMYLLLREPEIYGVL
jgi:chaperonin GroES